MIFSEIGTLKTVLLHKPLLALEHLTPDNCHQMLFDDVLWGDKANEEHDYFETLLRQNDVEVLLLHELMFEILSDPEAKKWLLRARLEQLYHQSELKGEMISFLNSQDPSQVTSYLLAGLTLEQSQFTHSSLTTQIMHKHDFLIPPLPNHLFARDSSSWIGSGLVINSMQYPARRGEMMNMAAIYKFHPKFKSGEFPIWYDGSADRSLPRIEGGDILVINEDALLIGISERTSAEAIEILARTLFNAGEITEIIAVLLPNARASMHLDTMLTMASHDTFVTAFPKPNEIQSWSLRPGDSFNEIIIEKIADFTHALAHAVDVSKVNLLHATGDYFALKREQWTDAANLLALAPGIVFAYDRNVEMNRKLRDHGITVHEIPSSELSRGRGGARCLTCPIERSNKR